jgi:cell division protease FtsH
MPVHEESEEQHEPMEMERVHGGPDELTPADAVGLASPYPPDVAKALSYLANLIDGSIQLRGVGSSVRDFAAAFLGVPTTSVVGASAELKGLPFQLAAFAFARDLERHPPAATVGEYGDEPPRWGAIELGEERIPIPLELAAGFDPDTVASPPLVVAIESDYQQRFLLIVYARRQDAKAGQAYLDGLLERSRRENPFKERILEAGFDSELGLVFRGVVTAETRRADLVLPEEAWEALDINVHGFFRALPALARTGLGMNRGILLEGPPGTGKTAVCRVLAGELDRTTVVFCEAGVISSSVRDLYRNLETLTPALVVIEDIDLIVGNRHGGGSKNLNDFLLALDGATSGHRGLVTIATTNDLDAIDPAARRAARFDVVVTIPIPNRAARTAILKRYLSSFEGDLEVDVERVAAAAEGASGADLRELVGRAVIAVAGAKGNEDGGHAQLTTSTLLDLIREGKDRNPIGHYL